MRTFRTPYRYDVVGSFLRPAFLKEARLMHESGKLDGEGLKAVEDRAITELVAKEKAAGLHVITDGEFRRSAWHLDFMWAFDGVGHKKTEKGLPFHGEAAMIDDTYLTGRLALSSEHPFASHFRFLSQFEEEGVTAKLTIPAPAQFAEQFLMPSFWPNSSKYYKDFDDLCADIVSCYVKAIGDFYSAGVRNLQLDDCSWGMLVDPRAEAIFATDSAGLEHIKGLFLEVNNAVLEALPDDLTVNTHVCRGNFHSTYASEGGYEGVASYLLEKEKVHAFFLEFDDWRSGGFGPLSHVPEDKLVVLGLVTTKRAELEDVSLIKERIREASRYVPLERLCLSPQCGFASCEIGNKLTEEEEWGKVRLVRRIAEEVWYL